MRFLINSPAIPDDLLIARDEGRVVFFCGAGVSRARAGLSDFFGLADDVICKLGVPTDHSACKVLNEAREMSKRTSVSGLISADRIFGLLERDFLPRDIEAKVAEALRPAKDVDLSVHKILLDLATTPEGRLQLVTTNFDRLFEDCSSTLKTWQPPNLPEFLINSEMNGIIYLHGRINRDYTGAEGDALILSSSEFGRAYLSDGWATQFIRKIIERYIVVFVGYAAEDPPVQYLLEALNRDVGSLTNVYAFQSGISNEAVAKWQHKGVQAISYIEVDGHRALWDTLEAWAKRAQNPDVWYKSVIDLAKQGPEKLQPHERGQVAHIISTTEGVRKFSEGDNLPPAEWLCVLDPSRRYAKPELVEEHSDEKTIVDPFDLYGIDSDVVPKQIDPDDFYEKRDIPLNTWDGFAANRLDRTKLEDNYFATIKGHNSNNIPSLSPRLAQIGVWISKIADQPTTVWWAAKQKGLHPSIRWGILHHLKRSSRDNVTLIHQAWQYIFEAWENADRSFHRDLHKLKEAIKINGWNRAIVRQFVTVYKPYLKANGGFWSGPMPPKWKEDLDLKDLLEVRIEYPTFRENVDIPDEWLACVVCEFRKSLEYAVYLESELGNDYKLRSISPIVEDDTQDGECHGRTRDLSGFVIFFSELFNRLIGIDATSARQEFNAWPTSDDTVFCRLRIWTSGMSNIIPVEVFAHIMTKMSNDAFWDSYHQRDLLLVLAKRWNELDEQSRKVIENRLLQGRNKYDGEDDAEFEEHKSWDILDRLCWLSDKGCEFTFDLKNEIKKLQNLAPKRKPEYTYKVVESMESRGGAVRTETEHSVLLDEPIHNILAKARKLSGRTGAFVEKDPYAGLSDQRPIRAFRALTNAAKHDEYPEWAWRTFLNCKGRKTDKPKFSMLIAERISSYSDEALEKIIGPVSYWLLDASSNLMSSYPQSFDRILTKLIKTLRCQPIGGNSSIVRGNKDPDWMMEAINAPVGKIAEALFNDPRIKDSKDERAFPIGWLTHVEGLLSLPDDLHRHALVLFTHQLGWFYWVDQDWTEANILSVLDIGDETDQNAIWSGFFWGAKLPNRQLYLRLKTSLIALAKQNNPSFHKYAEVLASRILAGWGSTLEEDGQRLISNSEMRDVLLHAGDEFRSHVLWKLKEWTEDNKNEVHGKWLVMLREFFADVWPRQKSVRTPTMSARISNLILSDAKYFPEVADIVIPLLTSIDQDSLMLLDLQREDSIIIDSYPERVLTILHAVLPDNVAVWPFGIETILQRIGEAKESLKSDSRLIELNRKWNSR